MLRVLRVLIGGTAALLLILWAGFLLLRDIPAGAYQPDIPAEQGGDDLVEVSRFLPLMTIRQVRSDQVARVLIVPVLQKLLPLWLYERTGSYEVSEDGQVMLIPVYLGSDRSVALNPISAEAHDGWLKKAETTRQEIQAQYNRIADATLTPTWSAPILGGRLGLHLSDDLVLAVNESAPGQLAVILSLDREFGYLYSLSIAPSGTVLDDIAQFRERFPGAQQMGPLSWIAQTDAGEFNIIAGISNGSDQIALAQARAEDEAEATLLMAALNGLTVGDAPYALADGRYIGPPSPTPDDLQYVIRAALSPQEFMRSDSISRTYETTNGMAEGMPWMQVTIQFGFLPEGTLIPPSTMQVLGEEADQGLKLEVDSTMPMCFPQRYHPIGAPQARGQLVMAMQSRDSGLPQCRRMAGILAGLDLDAMPEMQLAEKLAPHFGEYMNVRWDEDRIIASGPDHSVVLDQSGAELLTVPANLLWARRDGYVVQNADGQGLIDRQGQMILPMEYDDVLRSEQIGTGTTVIEVVKNGQHGLYLPERRAFLLPVEYDAIRVTSHDSVIFAEKEARFQIYDLTRGQMMPGLFRDYIIGATGRSAASERDFIALQREDGSWIFWTRQPQPLLEGRFQSVELETGPVSRDFHLTRADGSQFSITSDLELLPAE